jgi:WD40 repeat protein
MQTMICLIFLCSCIPFSSEPIKPLPITEMPLSAPAQTFTAIPLVVPTPLIINSPPIDLDVPDPTIDSSGNLRLNNIYINGDIAHCYPGDIAEINYSPNYKNVLVLVHCLEELNQLFLFQADGYSLLREITADSWEIVLGNKYSWSPNGNSIVYFRTACCTDAHVEIRTGLVRYDVRTADRKLLVASSYPESPPLWSPDGQWIAFLSPEFQNYPCTSLYVVSSSGSIMWKFEKFCLEKVRWSQANLSWEIENENMLLLRVEYEFAGKVHEKTYQIAGNEPNSSSVIYLTPIPEIDQP